MASRTPRNKPLVAVSIIGSLIAVAALGWAGVTIASSLAQGNPFVDEQLYVYPDSTAAQVAASASDQAEIDAATRLAATPSAVWVLPEAHPTAEVATFVDSVARDAQAKGELPVFVLYGITNRDCQNQSAGGLSSAEYPGWISAISRGLVGHQSVVILEPDALALAVECGNTDERVSEINTAIDLLQETNVMLDESGLTIYLDGGHSNWRSAEDMADLLTRAGIDKVRGFASNVSNFNDTASERAYADQLSDLTGGSHYVIDTSRSGNGSTSVWCNPSGSAIGESPATVDDGTRLDALLWIKTPGESDGNCNGGPAAGQWWPAGAISLVNNAG